MMHLAPFPMPPFGTIHQITGWVWSNLVHNLSARSNARPIHSWFSHAPRLTPAFTLPAHTSHSLLPSSLPFHRSPQAPSAASSLSDVSCEVIHRALFCGCQPRLLIRGKLVCLTRASERERETEIRACSVQQPLDTLLPVTSPMHSVGMFPTIHSSRNRESVLSLMRAWLCAPGWWVQWVWVWVGFSG
jgi:hypothetical protein